MKSERLHEQHKPLDERQFNYMLDFAIRQLNIVYYENGQRIPIAELRLNIKSRIKKLQSMKKPSPPTSQTTRFNQ